MDNSMNDEEESQLRSNLDRFVKTAQARRQMEFSGDLDSNFNFRCNSELKSEFKNLCKAHQITAGSVIKRYMMECIRANRIV